MFKILIVGDLIFTVWECSVHVAIQVKAQEEQFLHAQSQHDPHRRNFQA